MSPKLKALPLAVAQLIAAGAFSSLAVTPASAQMSATPMERIEVTGTNIRRTDSETPSEVQVITSQQMIQSGYTSVSQVLRDLTANGQGTLTQGFNRAFAGGGSGVALRGLTVGATLVLIDGYRMAGYPLTDDAQRNFVDISSIPFVAVDRIEVLLDGASAIYGSDAIAGVVNIILKKDFKGTNINVTGGTTTKGGGTTVDAQIMQGFGDVGAGLGGYVAFEYRNQDAVNLDQRQGQPWNVTDYTPWGGQNLNPGAVSGSVANPVIRGAPYLQKPGGSGSSASTFDFLTPTCNFAARNANLCNYTNDWGQIQPHTQNVNLIGSVTGRLNDAWSLNVTASYFDSEAEQHTNVAAIPAGSFGGITAIGPNQVPTIKSAFSNFTVPANYPGNTFGVPANVRAILPGVEARTANFDTGATRLVAQLTGSAWGWDIVGTAGYTNVRTAVTYNGYINYPNLVAGLQDPNNPYLLTGGNSQSLQSAVAPTATNTVWNNLSFIQAAGSHDLMQLQGGPMTLAVGAGDVYRNLQSPNPGAEQDGLQALPSAYAVGSQNNANLYAELAAPVLKSLEIDAAIRYDYYNVPSNSTWNPKVGAKWTPIKEFALRGTVGTGFRAPYITEAGNAGSLFGFNGIRDPQLCPVSNPDGSPNLTSPQNVPTQCAFNPTYLQGTSKDLKPEKSTSYTVGAIMEPIKGWSTTFDYYYIDLKNQIVPAASVAGFQPLNFAVRSTPQIVTFGDGSTGLSSVGPIQYINTPYVNAQQTTTSGFDLGTGYTWTLPDTSKFMMSAEWTHILTYDITLNGEKFKLAGTHGPSIVSGDTGNPKDRAQFVVQWAKGPFTATATVNYVGRFNVTDPSSGDPTCQDGLNDNNGLRWANTGVAPNYCNVASFTYTNLNFLYAVNKQWTLQASVQNAFNAKAPVDMATYGGLSGSQPNAGNNGVMYNPSLHQIGAVGPFWSIGFIYSFEPPPQAVPVAEKMAPPPPAPVAQPAPPPPPPPAPPPTPQLQKITLDSKVLFDFDKAALKPEGKAAIDSQVVGKLSQIQRLEVVLVTGYTDRIGTEAYNQKLSERRADAVRDYLVSKGVDRTKIETLGMGEKQPIVQCNQKEMKALIECLQPNRRVEVEAKGQGPK
jgi:iron complex outermembrane recepter protein